MYQSIATIRKNIYKIDSDYMPLFDCFCLFDILFYHSKWQRECILYFTNNMSLIILFILHVEFFFSFFNYKSYQINAYGQTDSFDYVGFS